MAHFLLSPKPLPARVARFALAITLLGAGALFAADNSTEAARDNEAILALRRGTLVIHAAPGATVKVEQVRHAFLFGAAISSNAFNGQLPEKDAARYRQVFLGTFNSGVTENALKWHSTEAERGKINYRTVDAILTWADANHLPLRGHNVYWGIEKFVQPWLKTMDDAELRGVLETHGREVAKRYRGRFIEYDLNNEMVHGNYYADRLGPQITREMAAWVKSEDPAAKIFLNDYDILTGRKLDAYVAQIRELLAQGVPIAGIGVQGHSHGQSFDRAALRHALDVLGQFKLPVRITEFNLPGQNSKFYEHPEMPISPEEEAQKARDISDYLRICFAHPAVEGVLLWGFWEGANWIPQSSLYHRDWTPTPAGAAFRDLVRREWWTKWEGKADAKGVVRVPAFFGTHRVTSGDQSVTVDLQRTAGEASVDFK